MGLIENGNKIRVKNTNVDEFTSYTIKEVLNKDASMDAVTCILEDLEGKIIEKSLNRINSKPVKIIKSKEDVDWVIHCIPDGIGGISYHTHGLKNYIKYELELNLPLELQVAQEFINLIAISLLRGDSDIYDGYKNNTLFSCEVMYLAMYGVQHPEEKHYRIVFPDSKGYFPDNDNCEDIFKAQI